MADKNSKKLIAEKHGKGSKDGTMFGDNFRFEAIDMGDGKVNEHDDISPETAQQMQANGGYEFATPEEMAEARGSAGKIATRISNKNAIESLRKKFGGDPDLSKSSEDAINNGSLKPRPKDDAPGGKATGYDGENLSDEDLANMVWPKGMDGYHRPSKTTPPAQAIAIMRERTGNFPGLNSYFKSKNKTETKKSQKKE